MFESGDLIYLRGQGWRIVTSADTPEPIAAEFARFLYDSVEIYRPANYRPLNEKDLAEVERCEKWTKWYKNQEVNKSI